MVDRQELRDPGFFVAPRIDTADNGLADVPNLAIGNPGLTGHRFRVLQGDPTALFIEGRGGRRMRPEAVVDSPDFLPSIFLELGAVRSRAVCLIKAEGTDYEGKFRASGWSGTGFLVGPHLLLTNHHVLNSIDAARSARCVFNFQCDAKMKPAESVAFRLEPDRLFLTSPFHDGLDYTFVWIESGAADRFGFIPLVRSYFTVDRGYRTYIVQHPDGRAKEVVLQNNVIINEVKATLLHYSTDTERGSSGAPVFNDRWDVIALHHASLPNEERKSLAPRLPPPDFLNEGIKISAIALDLERRRDRGRDGAHPRDVLAAFSGIDSATGYFGSRGRQRQPGSSPTREPHGSESSGGVDSVVDAYNGENRDIDVAFWNISWFSQMFEEKLDVVATSIADLNLDIWILTEATADAAKALVAYLQHQFEQDFGLALATSPTLATTQPTAVLWNRKTVDGERLDWPADIDGWFRVGSEQLEPLRQEGLRGPVFDRYPGLFRFAARNRIEAGLQPYRFHLVPLQLAASDGQSARRHMAARILAAAINRMVREGATDDWVIGGDFNAEAADTDAVTTIEGGFAAVGAASDTEGAIMCLKGRKSPIERIFLSPNLRRVYGVTDLLVPVDDPLPDHLVRLSEHVPVLLRLTLADRETTERPPPASLVEALGLSR